MKGNIKIELFDAATGEKEKDFKDTNFIAIGLKSLIRESAFNSIMRYKAGYSINEFNSSESVLDNLFLTYSDSAGDPENDFHAAGNVVGQADLANGTFQGPTAGIVNNAESGYIGDKLKLVIDFATDKGNGTFNNIYTGGNTIFPEKKGYMRSDLSFVIILQDGEFYYTVEKDGKTISKRDGNLNVLESRVISEGAHALTIHQGFLYLKDSSSWSYTNIKKINLSDFLNSEITTHKKPKADTGNFFSTGESLYCLNQQGTELFKVTEVDNIMTAEKEANINGSSYKNSIFYRNGALIDDTDILDLEGNVRRRYFTGFIGFYKNFAVRFTNNKFYIQPCGQIGSRSILSEPVTKTDKQTMKITYEFTLPPLFENI